MTDVSGPALFVRERVESQMREIGRLEPLVRQGGDPDAVHAFRVAIRRIRALREFLPSAVDEDARWLGRTLGEARDRDIQIETLREFAGKDPELEPLLRFLLRERILVQAKVVAALDSPRFTRLRAGLTDFPMLPEQGWAEALADRAKGRMKKAANLNEDSSGPDFHRLRKRVKRLRYVLEALEPLLGKRARKEIAALKELQDKAGVRQDDATTIETVQRLLHEPDLPRGAAKAGERLVAKLEKRERKHRREVLRVLGG